MNAELEHTVPPHSAHGRYQDLAEMAVMIVDDIPVNVRVAHAHLEAAGYKRLICVTESTDAISRIHDSCPDLILLDIMMPSVSGLDILRMLRSDKDTSQIPVLVLTGAESSELKTEALALGATDFLMKPVDVDHLLPRVRNCLVMKQHQDDLKTQIRQRTLQLKNSQDELIECLSRAARYRNYESWTHFQRVGLYSRIIADELDLPPTIVACVRQAATLHDVGILGMAATGSQECPMAGEQQTRRPSDSSLRDHTIVGGQILNAFKSPTFQLARSIALTHHEKWDGTGYPFGLAGEDIPVEGRITAIADAFDTLHTGGLAPSRLSLNDCLTEIKNDSGRHFDPRAVEAFIRRRQDIIAVQLEHVDFGREEQPPW